MTGPATLPEAFAQAVARRPDAVFLRTLDDGIRWTWREVDELARRAAAGLASLGVRAGDTVGLLLDNRPEFHVADLGAVLLGAVPVSIYATSSAEQIEYIAGDADARVIVTQASYLPTVLEAVAGRPECVVVVLDGAADDGDLTWEELLSTGAVQAPVTADPHDLLTIIYTSGTTGPPKGVELSHHNLLSAMRAIGELNELGEGRVVSWLPMAHIAERNASYYAAILFGLEVTTCPDARQIGAYLQAVRPTWFFAVPRVWEKLRAGAQAAMAARPELDAGDVRAALGLDRLRAANIGAAPSAPELITFFHELGVPLAEIYGMSEGCACCTCNPPGAIRVGSAGVALPGVELRIEDDGEVLMRSEVLMRGYRNLPEATAAAFTEDGFYRTGDIGRLDEDGYLWIVDRKKELIISSGGKNMSPANIEAAIKTRSSLIGHLCVVGDRRPYNVALVVLDPLVAAGRGPDDPEVRAEIDAAVAAGNATLSRAEQIKRYIILDGDWAPGGDELTPTMKLRRRPIADKYAAQIEALYAEREAMADR